MSSREIAELTGKRHSDVMRDIRVMLLELRLPERKFASSYFDSNGQERPAMELNKELTETLVSGYSIKLRHAIIKRWNELEAKESSALILPQTFSEALQLAANQAKQLEDQAPKIKVYERLADRKDNVCLLYTSPSPRDGLLSRMPSSA